jgi:hypothetical protein
MNDVIGEFLVAASENNLNMLPDQSPIASLWLNAPALPEVKTLVDHLGATWPERYATILSAIAVT